MSSTPRAVGFLISFVVVLWMGGCDRDRPDLEPDEVDTAQESEGAEEEQASIYDEMYGVDPVEPFDMGPPAPAVYFTAGLKGYTEPCGCTADVMLGGIDRITAFVKDARGLHDEAVFIDAGDWLFEHPHLEEHLHPQERAKAEVLAAAHRSMGTLFSVPGDRDLSLGVPFYLEMMEEAQMTPLSANLRLDGEALQAVDVREIDGVEVAFIGAGDPGLYDGIDGVSASDDRSAIEAVLDEVDDGAVAILVYQGSVERATEMMEAVSRLDFVVVGHDPRLRTQPEEVGQGFMLEARDQGRYVGRLKLYGADFEGSFVDGRGGISEQRDGLRSQIEHVERDLRVLEVRTEGQENPMSQRLKERLEGLQERQEQLERDGIDIPDGSRAFLYDAIAMEPGYRLDEELRERRVAYNRSLRELNQDLQREVIPVAEGEPFYIGTPECTSCHLEAHNFWEGTAHSSAVATLEERDKEYDQNCIGCHVVGWEEPGGSVLGKLVYQAELDGRVFEKDLTEVGCESCHGPGSAHRQMPIDGEGIAQHIIRHPTEAQCTQCHVPEHSPRFDFDVYVRQITGEGHEYTGAD